MSSGFTKPNLDAFHRDGYVIERGLVSATFCDQLRGVIRQHLDRHEGRIEYEAELRYPGAPGSLNVEGGRTPRRLQQAISRDVVFTELVMLPELRERLRQLLGETIVMPLAHHNCVMTKQPGFSSDTGWHQDIRYWSFEKPDLVSVWLALGEETAANGCLQLIPGTHLQPFSQDRLDSDLFLREELPENQALIAQRRFTELSCGDVLFFHCRTFHAATRNHTDAPKYSVVFTFRGAENSPLVGTRSASLPELLIPPNR